MSSAAFPAKTSDEAKLLTFDFTREAADGSTFSSPSVAKSLARGTDTAAATLSLGVPAVSGYYVKVLVSAGATGNLYELTAKVNADNGEIHELAATMLVDDAVA